MGALPPVFIEFLGSSTGFMATAKGVKTELATVEAEGGGRMRKLGGVAKAALLGIGVAATVTAAKTVHMAADFQTQMTRIRTSAGETAGNMQMVSQGVLRIAGEVGEKTSDLTAGLYNIESAGFHGADGLAVLKAAAEGAKVGNADMATVADAATTALNSYGLKGKEITHVMNALIGAEAEGKATMEDLAGAMSGILPVSAAAHVGMNEVLGAMSTMTAQGTNARVAATYLRQTIGQLSNPSAKAAATMKGLGLSATAVSKELGSRGLAATLTTLTDAIKAKMGPSGTVLIKTLEKASKSGKDFQAALNKASGSQKTYIGALATMVGGTKSMMGALQLTGPHMATFKKNVQGISDHVKEGGKNIEGWADVQKTFNQRMSEFKGSAEALGISIGNRLLPAATKMAEGLSKGLSFLEAHQNVLKVFGVLLAGVTLGLAAAAIASWSFTDSLLADPITWIVVGIVALIAGIAELIVHWKAVSAWLSGTWNTVVHKVGSAWDWLKGKTLSAWHSIENGIKTAWHAVASFFSAGWHMVTDPIVAAWRWVSHATSVVWGAISGFFRKWWPLLVVIFMPFVALLIHLWNQFGTQIMAGVTSVWNSVKSFLSDTWSVISAIASVAWIGVKNYVVNPIKEAWNWLSGAWSSISSWLSGKWAEISAIASVVWGAIKSNIVNPIMSAYHSVNDLVEKLRNAITSKIRAAWNDVKNIGSLFMSVGRDIVSGIISGVEGAAGSLFSSLKSLAGNALKSAKDFLGINSPSRVMRDEVGRWIPAGIAEGITAHADTAHAAVRSTAEGMVSEFSSALGIASPSKVFRQLGIWIHQGLIDGLTGSSSKVKSTIKHTETLLMQAYNKVADLKGTKGVSNKWVKSHEAAIKRMEAYVSKEGAVLGKLASKREALAKRLKTAQANLASLQKEWTKERNDVASNIMQGASVVMSPDEAGGALTAGDVLANMQDQARAANAFASNLSALQKKGLRSDLIQQIAAAGVDGGGATAQALLTANSNQIKQLNATQKNMLSSANKTGGAVADSMYGAGINAAKGLIKGLQSQEKAIDKQMLAIAKRMENAIKKALGIHSPSRLFHEIGSFVTAGLVNGIDAGNRDVESAAGRMSSAVIKGADVPALSGSVASGGRVVHNVHIEVHGSVRSDRDLRDVVQQEMLRYGGRNTGTWQSYKR